MMDWTYAKAVALADHLHSIGMTEIYLDRAANPFPWALVTSCKPGGSHRLDIDTSVRFVAFCPKSKLTFTWVWDLEPYSASGSGSYQIDAAAAKGVLSSLAGEAHLQFRLYLDECAVKVAERGRKYQELADKQLADATLLHRIVHTQ